jgi:hypothetical protein
VVQHKALHSAEHEVGGRDELDVTGLTGAGGAAVGSVGVPGMPGEDGSGGMFVPPTPVTSSGGSTIAVEEANVSVDSAVTTLDFDGEDFTLTSDGADEVDIALDMRVPRYVYKSADTDRSSTTTLADDPDLQFPMVANARYQIRLFLRLQAANATPDIQFAFAGPTGFAGGRWFEGNVSSTGLVTTFSGTQVIALTTTQDNYIIEAQFTCTADGTCTFQWAQNISDAGATSVKAGSNMMFARVN